MMRSMYSGVSGLKNHQTRMDVIGNNIANVNTSGYKKSRVVFKDMLYQNLRGATSATEGGRGGTNPMGIGTGMALGSIDQIHSPAPTAGTSKMTDMAIDGDGYFILGVGNERYYTRAGAFDFDPTGNLISNANGMHVMGWVANPQDWTLATNQAVQPIDISRFKELPPKATTGVVFTGNLDAGSAFKAGLNEQQALTFATIPGGGAAGGFFRLNYGGQTTDWIQVGANTADTAGNIQTALERLSNVGTGNIAVAWDPVVNRYNFTFQGNLARQNTDLITFVPGPVTTFDGGEASLVGDSINNYLSFADFAEGGTPNGTFVLSVGNRNTGLIRVGANSAATAGNIQSAINALSLPNSAQAAVTWDNTNNRYNIVFNRDPGGVLSFTPINALFDGGAANVTGGATQDATIAFATTPSGGTAGGNFILSVNGLNTGLIEVGQDETETALNMEQALNALQGAPQAIVSWDPAANNYKVHFATVPTAALTVATPVAGTNILFDGGAVSCGTQHPTITFATTPGGGTAGGAFRITMGDLQTGPIVVGSTQDETARNMENALNQLSMPNGAVATVSWDAANSCYQIDFNVDPQQALSVATVTPFNGGNGAVSLIQDGQAPLIIAPRNEVQTLIFSDNANGGTPGTCFRLAYNGVQTGFIMVGNSPADTAQNIQTALEALPAIGTGNVAVNWDENNRRYNIVFQGALRESDVDQLSFVSAPVFDGGPADISNTQNYNLSFATTPTGGTAGGNFILSFNDSDRGPINTGLIAVDADTDTTAANIQNAINTLALPNGAQATVTWDAVNSRYQIEFDQDPGIPMSFSPVNIAFDGGTADVQQTAVPSWQNVQLSFLEDPADPNTWTNGGTEGGSFILSIGTVNTGIINVGASPIATARNIRNAINQLELHNGSTLIQVTDVQWDDTNHRYDISFNVDPQEAVTFTAASAQFDGGTETVSGTQEANLAFDIDPDGGSEGGSFVLTLGTGSNALQTDAITVGRTPQETAARIEYALNHLANDAALPNNSTATVSWNASNQVYNIAFSSDPGLVIGFARQPFDGGTPLLNTLLQGSSELEYPGDNECIITSKEVFNSLGTPETLYFRFFKYEIQPGDGPGEGSSQPVSRWGCDISTEQMFENTEGYNPLTDFSAIDINGEQPRYGTGTKLYRLYNIEFDENGSIKNTNPHMSLPFNQQVPVPGSGAANPTIDVDLSLITQHDGESTARVSQDGHGQGQLKSYNVDSNGSINGVYNNGEIRELARVALASFANPAGLMQQGGTMFKESINSGVADIGKSGDPGLGTIAPSSLEMSNVDLSEEFTDMIVTQRGFQANSRIITTSDEMLQELMNLKR